MFLDKTYKEPARTSQEYLAGRKKSLTCKACAELAEVRCAESIEVSHFSEERKKPSYGLGYYFEF